MKKQFPNILTVLRIIGAAALAVMPVFTVPFFAVYGVCILSDFGDGFLAKKLNAKTELGRNLDHIASILFIAFLSVRYGSVMQVPEWALYILTGIAFLKCTSIVFGTVRNKKLSFINTDWNKWAKCAFYLAPLWYLFAGMAFACAVILFMLLVSTVEELIINLTAKEFNPDKKTIINIKGVLKKFKKKSK